MRKQGYKPVPGQYAIAFNLLAHTTPDSTANSKPNSGRLRPYVTQGDELGGESQPDGATRTTLAVSASS